MVSLMNYPLFQVDSSFYIDCWSFFFSSIPFFFLSIFFKSFFYCNTLVVCDPFFSETSIHSMFHFNAKNIVHSCWRLPILDNNKYICMTHVCNRNIKHTMVKCKLASMNLFGNKSLNQFGPSLLIHSIYKYYKFSVMIRNTKSCWPLWNETFQCSLSLNVCVCVCVFHWHNYRSISGILMSLFSSSFFFAFIALIIILYIITEK